MGPLAERRRQLLQVLRISGGWLRRQDIARALGQEQLSAEDSMALDQLAEKGHVIQEISDNLAPQGEMVRYRVSQPK